MVEQMLETPVLIVGGGPVGLALAGDLGFRGMSCLLVEASDGTVTQPKMDMVGVRTMEYCRRWGITHWVEGRRLQPGLPAGLCLGDESHRPRVGSRALPVSP